MRKRTTAYLRRISKVTIHLCLIFAVAAEISPAEAKRNRKKSKTPSQEIELATPERMLGYSELMRLKPAVRTRYRKRIASMLAEISELPTTRRRRLIVDASEMGPGERFFHDTWAMLFLPRAFAVPANVPVPPTDRPSNPRCSGSGTIEANTIKLESKACKVDPTTNEPKCETGYFLMSDPKEKTSLKCVKESDYRKAMGERAVNDWKAASEACDAKRKQEASGTAQKTDPDKLGAGKPCIYAGWIQETEASGSCPRPKNKVEIPLLDGKKITVSCPKEDQVLCNPGVFGVVGKNGNDYVGVCIAPSIHATMNCRALSVPADTRDVDGDPNSPLISNPDEAAPEETAKDGSGDKFKGRRADFKATETLFNTPGFGDFYNQHVDKQAEFCSSSSTDKKNQMLHFCDECQALAQKMSRANGEITAGASGGAPGTISQ